MGPSLPKEMLERSRSESIRSIFHLTGLVLLRGADQSGPDLLATIAASIQQTIATVPSLESVLQNHGLTLETLDQINFADHDFVISLTQDILTFIIASGQPASENQNVIALRKRLDALAPRPDDSDEVGMDRLRKFAAFLQEWRSSHLSQMQFLDLLHSICPVKYTQTCLSRFEKGNLSYQSMRRMHNYIAKTMLAFAENPFAVPATVRKRKQRETISLQVRQALEAQFAQTPRPTMDALQTVSRDLNLSLETTRYWFQNARSSMKKMRPDGSVEIGCRADEEGQQ